MAPWLLFLDLLQMLAHLSSWNWPGWECLVGSVAVVVVLAVVDDAAVVVVAVFVVVSVAVAVAVVVYDLVVLFVFVAVFVSVFAFVIVVLMVSKMRYLTVSDPRWTLVYHRLLDADFLRSPPGRRQLHVLWMENAVH